MIAYPSYDLHGPLTPASPIVMSVPHAGRDYPPALHAALRVTVGDLMVLEDRYVDVLALAARGTETLLVQRNARAWIDLNRAESERDPHIDKGADRRVLGLPTAKVRGGLGLIPRRLSTVGEIWARRLHAEEVMARIVLDHRPYHAALAATLEAARARFGIAILLDIHSMPSLDSGTSLVFGDRRGKSSGSRFVDRLQNVASAAGVTSALNSPYAGAHVLERHGQPDRGVHAIQIEFDRALYLDDQRRDVSPAVIPTTRLLRQMIDAVRDEALNVPAVLAAE